jgi:prepilin-type N-terminal cleavage/methylation domain-containing protein
MVVGKRAFTLIELLVVIAVIAVLMGGLMPALRAAREQGRTIRCGANVGNLSMAWLMYQDDNDGQLVPACVSIPVPSVSFYYPKEPNWWINWRVSKDLQGDSKREKEGIRKGLLYSYVKDVSAYHCPSDIRTRITLRQGGPADGGIGGFRTHSIAEAANGGNNSGYRMIFSKKYMDIKSPASKYIFVPGSGAHLYSAWQLHAYDELWMMGPMAIWHARDKSTLGWADGHVESHRWQDKATIELASYATKSLQGNETPSEDWEKHSMYQGEDIRYMVKGFPVKKLLSKPGP